MRAIQVRWMVAGLAAAGTLAAGATVWLLSGSEPATKPAARTAERSREAPGERVSSDSVTAKGTVEPVSTQSLSFSMTGTVTAVSVKPGDMVVPGQAIAKIDQADARQAVADAQSALDDAQAALDDAWASASASPTTASCPSAASDPAPRTSSSAPRASSTPSPRASAVSPSPSARASGIVAAPAVYQAAGSCGSGNTSGSSQRGGGGGGGGGDAILAAQQDVNNDKAALARAQRQLDGTVLTSPVAGKVLAVTIKVGDTARSNVVELGVVSTMVVQASFSEADVVALKVGDTADVVLPGRGGETFSAKVSQIAETGTATNNLVTYAVTLVFDKVPDGILVGQSANVTVTS